MRKLLLMGVFFTTAAFAQMGGGGGMGRGGGGDMGEGGGGGGRNGGMSLPSVGPARMDHLDSMASILKLSKEQKKEVKSIMDDGQKQGTALHEQIRKCREQIAAAVAAGKSPDEIGQAVKAYSEVEGQMARIELDAFARIYKLLDTEQKSKTAPVFQMMAGIFMNKNWNEA